MSLKTSAVFTLNRKNIPCRPGEPFKLIPFGDIHRDSDMFAMGHWKRFLDYASAQKNAWFLGMGDYCLPMDAKVLTTRGFMGPGEIQKDDLVYGRNPETGDGQWTEIKSKYFTPSQPMIEMRSKSFIAKCTPNHGWLVKNQDKPGCQSAVFKKPTKDLKSSHRIVVASKYYGEGHDGMSPDDAARLAWIVTEGHSRADCLESTSIAQNIGKNLDEITHLFREMKTSIYQSPGTDQCVVYLSRPKVREFFSRIGYTGKRDMPRLAAKLSAESAERMMDVMLRAEGWMEKGHWRFSQKTGPVLDAFKIIATLCGKRIGMTCVRAKSGVAKIVLTARSSVTVADLKFSKGHSSEPAWCLETGTGNFVMQYKGQISLTGNCDAFSTSERSLIADDRLHDSTKTTLEEHYHGWTTKLAKELEFMKGKLLGLHGGNHYVHFRSGETSDQRLCRLLGTNFLGVSSFFRLNLMPPGNERGMVALDVFSHHGKGSGKRTSGAFNAVEDMANYADADLYCVDDSTECLTDSGWKKRTEINIGDTVAAFDLQSSQIQWTPVIDKVEFDYSGEAIRFKNYNHDSLLHPKHRVVYKYKHGWNVKEAKQVSEMTSQIKIPLCGHQEIASVEIGLSDDELMLMGWIVSEGSFKNISGVRIHQKFDPKVSMIRDLLVRMAWDFSELKKGDGSTVFYLPMRYKNKILSLLPQEKNIPKSLMKCSDRQFKIFLSTLVMGDGSGWGHRAFTVYQAREQFIDDLQACCAVHGFRTVKSFKPGGFKNGGWCLSICDRTVVEFALHKKIIGTEHYSGKMWCITTKQTTFVARRNNRVFVTGNCMGHDHSRGVIPAKPRLKVTLSRGELHLSERTPWFGRTGSFLAAYDPGRPSYNVDAGRGPCSLGWIEFEITLHRDGTGDRKYHVEIRGIA